MRPRLQRLVSLWRKRLEPTDAPAEAGTVATPDDAPATQPPSDETEQRLADAQARLKRSVQPKDE